MTAGAPTLCLTAGAERPAGSVPVDLAAAAALSATVREATPQKPPAQRTTLEVPGATLPALELVGRYLAGEEPIAVLGSVEQDQWRVVGQVAAAAHFLRCDALLDASAARLAGWITGQSLNQIRAWLCPPPRAAPNDLMAGWLNRQREAPWEWPYNGDDPNLLPGYKCFARFANEDKHGDDDGGASDAEPARPLAKCSRCRVARYCCRECQVAHWGEHKASCKAIQTARRVVDTLGEQLTHAEPMLGGPPENYFEKGAGRFWGLLTPRDYCIARFRLAEEITSVAYETEMAPLWEKVLAHQLELLRLTTSDNQGVRQYTPFVLLHLNRDADCHGFIKHWLREDVDYNAPTWPQGEWPYPANQDTRESMFEVYPEAERRKWWELSFLAALAIIKMRIVEKLRQRAEQWALFAAHPAVAACGWAENPAVRPALHRRVVDALEEIVAAQERHLMEYLTQIHANNPTLLPAILNPRPLKQQPPPHYYSPGAASEAWGVLDRCNRLFARIPHHQEWIERVIGPTLADTYDATIAASPF